MEVFCVHAQKFLIVILDNKVFQAGLFAHIRNFFNRDEDFLRTCAETP